jgi:hypothetical protein
MPDAQRTRSLACKVKNARKQVTTGTPDSPAFPARWVTAYTSSPRCPGFLATVALWVSACCPKGRHRHTARLDLSVGRSGPLDFAVRTRIVRLLIRYASTAPCSTFRDDWPQRPSWWNRMGAVNHEFLKNGSIIFLRPADSSNQLDPARKIRRSARPNLRRSTRAGKACWVICRPSGKSAAKPA